MNKSSGKDAFQLLNSLASDWSSGRGSLVLPASKNRSKGELETEGPGFLFRWDDTRDPIQITFLADGPHLVSTEGQDNVLFMGVASDSLSVKEPKKPSLVIKTGSSPLQQRLDDIIAEVRDCTFRKSSKALDALTAISAGQRLVTLGHDAFTENTKSNPKTKLPAKQRFVSDLHEWLARELRNSVKLGDAAKQFNKSPRQLIRILKETTGSGFAEHLTMHRLVLARTLLMRSDGSIMDVAKQAGFNSREQFIRSFNKAFGWTPLQFRKGWSRAALTNSELEKLCHISERESVTWTEPGEPLAAPEDSSKGKPHTLVVVNALHEVVELFAIDLNGRTSRVDVLVRGAMTFINRDTAGSCWLVRAPDSGLNRSFISPEKHAVAVISPAQAD